MFPKEHGAWNALFISLAAGWAALGTWHETAIAASLLWLCAFILRAPLSTFRQYRIADPPKSRNAGGFAFFLIAVLLGSGWIFFRQAPAEALWLALGAGAPLGLLLFFLAFTRSSLRFLGAELLGFAGICLCAPVLYLLDPTATLGRAALLYFLLAGYFGLSLFYVRARLSWLNFYRKGKKRDRENRWKDLTFVLKAGILWTACVEGLPDANPWLALAPLYALGRMEAGILWGKAGLPMMKLGFREMIHSLVFLILILAAWK